MWYIYSTKLGKLYPINIGFVRIRTNEVVFDYERITRLCQTCKNYNSGGGCPPRAPRFDAYTKNHPFGLLIYASLSSEYKSQRVKESNSYYIHFRSQDIILSRLLTEIGYKREDNILLLNNGYCMGCAKCNVKCNGNCIRPEKRTFSLEATGIDVVSTMKKFNITFEWYNKHNYKDVKYMTKVIGLFSKQQFCNPEKWLVDALNSLIFTKYKIESPQYFDCLERLLKHDN